MGPPLLLTLVLSLILLSVVVPTDETSTACKCSQTCTDGFNHGYEIGLPIRFRYESSAATSIARGAHSPTLRLTADVEVVAVDRCNLRLIMSGASFEVPRVGSPSRRPTRTMEQMARALERHATAFTMVDGHIGSICSSEAEWVLNVKRSAIAHLQLPRFATVNSLLSEDTLHGRRCTVHTEVQQRQPDSALIRRSANMSSCEGALVDLGNLYTPFAELNQHLRTLTLLRGEFECEQRVAIGNDSFASITESECRETRAVSDAIGLRVTSKLTRQPTNAAASARLARLFSDDAACPRERHALQLTSSSMSSSGTSERPALEAVREALTRSCRLKGKRVGGFAQMPLAFIESAALLKRLDGSSLYRLFSELNSICPSEPLFMSTAMYGVYYCIYEYRKYLVDSLLVIQTPEACSALIRFALEGRATFEELMLAVESLSFVHTPSRELVSALQPMLRSYANEIQASRTSLWLARGTGPNALSEAQQQKLVTKLHLTLGTLLSRYCAASPAECAADPIWTLMASVYSWLLGPGCESDFCRVMMVPVLKSLGNAGPHHIPLGLSMLERIYSSSNYPLAARLAAVDALSNLPCDKNEAKESLLTVFSSSRNALELRVAAYRQLVRCPTPTFLHYLRGLLEQGRDTESPQLHAFVLSHLRTLARTGASASGTASEEGGDFDQSAVTWRRLLASEGIALDRFDADLSTAGLRVSRELSRQMQLPLGESNRLQANAYWLWNDAPSSDLSNNHNNESASLYWPSAAGTSVRMNLFGRSFDVAAIDARFSNVDAFFQELFQEFISKYLNPVPPIGAAQARKLRNYMQSQPPFPENTKTDELDKIQKLDLDAKKDETVDRIDQKFGADLSVKLFGYQFSYEQFVYTITEELLGELESDSSSESEDSSEESSPDEERVPLPGATDDAEESEPIPPPSNSPRARGGYGWWKALASVKRRVAGAVAKLFHLRLKQEIDFEWSRTLQLVSFSRHIPTSFGLPLLLSVNGSAFVDVKVDGALDIGDLTNFDVKANILPGLNTKLVSFAGFSLPATSGAAGEEVGVRMMNSLESDLELNVEAKMDGARVVKFAWNIPRDKMSLLRVSTKFEVVEPYGDEEDSDSKRIALFAASESSELCAPPGALGELLGAKLCLAISVPHVDSSADTLRQRLLAPLQVALGSELQLSLQKTDTHSGYLFEYINQIDGDEKQFKLWFDMPGSTKMPRRLGIDVGLNIGSGRLRGALATPWRVYQAEGSMKNTADEKRVQLTVQRGAGRAAEHALAFLAEYVVNRTGDGSRYQSRVELDCPALLVWRQGQQRQRVLGLSKPLVLRAKLESAATDGGLADAAGNRADRLAELAVENVFRQPFILKARASKVQRYSREAYEVNFEVGSSLVSAQGSLLHKKYLSDIERSYTHLAELTYTWFRARATTLWFSNELKARVVQQGEKTRREYSVTTAATNGGEQWSLAGAISYELSPGRRLQRLPDALNYSLQLSGPASSGWTAANYGTIVQHTLSWQQARTATGEGLSSSLKASFEIPSSEIAKLLELKLATGDQISGAIKYQYKADKIPISAKFDFQRFDSSSFSRSTLNITDTVYSLRGELANAHLARFELESELLKAALMGLVQQSRDSEALAECEVYVREVGLHTKQDLKLRYASRSQFEASVTGRLLGADSGLALNSQLRSSFGARKVESTMKFELISREEPVLIDVALIRDDSPYGQLYLKLSPISREFLAPDEDYDTTGLRSEIQVALPETVFLVVNNTYKRSERTFLMNTSLDYSFPRVGIAKKLNLLVFRQITDKSMNDRAWNGQFHVRVDGVRWAGLEFTTSKQGLQHRSRTVFTWSQRVFSSLASHLLGAPLLSNSRGGPLVSRVRRLASRYIRLVNSDEDERNITAETNFLYDNAVLYKALNSSISVRTPLENADAVDLRLNLYGQLMQVRIDAELAIGAQGTQKRWRADLWFRPFEVYENQIGVRLITPHTRFSYAMLELKYALTRTTWLVELTQELDARKRSFGRAEWSSRGTFASASESGSASTIRRTRDWSIGIAYTRHDGEQLLRNTSLLFAHRDDQKAWTSSLSGVLNSNRSLNASFRMALDDQSESFSFFGLREANAKKSKGEVAAVLMWDGGRHDLDQRWEYWPSKRFATSPSGTFDSINLSFESRLNSPSLWRLQRTAKGTFTLSVDSNWQTLELDAQTSSNVPDYEKFGVKYAYERTSSGTRSTAEILVPKKLKHPEQRAIDSPVKITVEVTRSERTQGSAAATLTQPFAFGWQQPSAVFSHVEFKSEFNLASTPFKFESELTMTPLTASGVKQFRFTTEARLADWSADRFGLSDSSKFDLLFLYGRYLKQVKLIGTSNVRGLERYSLTIANELVSDGGLKLKTDVAVQQGAIKYKYSQELLRQLPTSSIMRPLQAEARLQKESVDFSVDLFSGKLTIGRSSSELTIEASPQSAEAEAKRYKLTAEQNYDLANLKGSLELQSVSGSSTEKMIEYKYSLQESRGSRFSWKASVQYFTKNASFDWQLDRRARKFSQRFLYTEDNTPQLKHELEVELFTSTESSQQSGIDFKYELLNEKFDKLPVRNASLKHQHLIVWSAPLGWEQPKRSVSISHRTEVSVNDRLLLLLESPCAVELDLPSVNIRIEMDNARLSSDWPLALSLGLRGGRFLTAYTNASKEFQLELAGTVRHLRPAGTETATASETEKSVSAGLEIHYKFGSGITLTSQASLNTTGDAIPRLPMPGVLILRTEATIDPFRGEVAQPHLVLHTDIKADDVEMLYAHATFQFTNAEQPLEKPYLFAWNSALRGVYDFPLGLNINTSQIMDSDRIQLTGAFCLKEWFDFDVELQRDLNSAKAKVLKRSSGESAVSERATFNYAYQRESSRVNVAFEYVLPGSTALQKTEAALSWQNEDPTSWPTALTLELDTSKDGTKEVEQRISVQIPERRIMRAAYRETMTYRGERVLRREIDAWPFKYLFEYNSPSSVSPASRALVELTIDSPDADTLAMRGTGNYGEYRSTAVLTYVSGRSLELSIQLDQTTPPANGAEFKIDYTLKVATSPQVTVESAFRGGLPVQHDLRLAPGSVSAQLPNGITFSGAINSTWPEVEVSVTSNHELIADSRVRFKLQDTQPLKKLELELHNRYLARTYAPSSASETLLFSTAAALDMSSAATYAARAAGSIPVCAFLKDYNVSAQLSTDPNNFSGELALRYGPQRSKWFETALSFAREERGISAASVRVAASEFPFLSNVKLAYSNDFSGQIALSVDEQRNSFQMKRAPNLEINIDLPTLQLRELLLSLNIEGQLSTPSKSDFNVTLASSFQGEDLLKIRLQRPATIAPGKPLLAELSSRWTSLKLFRFQAAEPTTTDKSVQLKIESIFLFDSKFVLNQHTNHFIFNNSFTMGENRYQLEITDGDIPVKLSVRGWPFATGDVLETEVRYATATCPRSMNVSASLQWPRAELITAEWTLESLAEVPCERITEKAFRSALKIESGGTSVFKSEFRLIAANMTALLTARTTQTEITIPFNEKLSGTDAKRSWTGVEIKCSGARYLGLLAFYERVDSDPMPTLVGLRAVSPWDALRELELDLSPADVPGLSFTAHLLYRGLLDTGRATVSVDVPLARVLQERGTLDDTVNRLEIRAPDCRAFKVASLELQLTQTSCKLAAALDNKRVTIATNYTYDLSLNKVTNEYLVETPISWLERARLTINATTQAYRINYKLGLEHNLLGTNKLQIEATTGEENRLRLLLEAEKSDWKRAEFEILTNEQPGNMRVFESTFSTNNGYSFTATLSFTPKVAGEWREHNASLVVDSRWPGGSKTITGSYQCAWEPELILITGSSTCSQHGTLTLRVSLPLVVSASDAPTEWRISAINTNPTFNTNVTLAVTVAKENTTEPQVSFTARVEAPGVGKNEFRAQLHANKSLNHQKFELNGTLAVEYSLFSEAQFTYFFECKVENGVQESVERLTLQLPRAEQNGWQRESFCEWRLRTPNTEASHGLFLLQVNPRSYPNQRVEYAGEHRCDLPFEIFGVRSVRSNLSHVSSWSDGVWVQETTESTIEQPGPEQTVVYRNRIEYHEDNNLFRWSYTRNGRQLLGFFLELPVTVTIRVGVDYNLGPSLSGSMKYSGQFGGKEHQNHSFESSKFGNWRFGYFFSIELIEFRFDAGVDGLGGSFDEGVSSFEFHIY